MNLMTQAVANIYQHGNAILCLKEGENTDCKIIFYVGNNKKLCIKVEKNYGDNCIDIFDLNIEEGLAYVALLVYYSFANSARNRDLVYLTTEIKKIESQLAITAINELYYRLIPMISTEKEHIEFLAKMDANYKAFVNSFEYIDSSHKILSSQNIMQSLIERYNEFEKTLRKANLLWKKMGEGSIEKSNNAANEWNDFLNKLYIDQSYDLSKIDLNHIDIDYEFLTSKSYISNPAIDCEEEIENLEIALLTPSKSAILVGPPGIGKTAIVEGLSYKISTGQVPNALHNKKVLKINTSSFVRGCRLVGMFEEKVEKIMHYLVENPDTFLFIDEIHTTIGAGVGSNDSLDLANIIKPYIDRGQVKVIGTTTEEEYEKYIKSDKAFNRRFQKITISEPKRNAVCQIIKESIEKLEKMTNIAWNFDDNISEMIINHIVECTDEKHRVYNDKRYNPDISLTILESAFAIALLRGVESVSIENISDAIRRSEFLYKSIRTNSADELLFEYQSITHEESTNITRCKIIKFPNSKR